MEIQKEIESLKQFVAWYEARQKETGIYNGPYQQMKEGYLADIKRLEGLSFLEA